MMRCYPVEVPVILAWHIMGAYPSPYSGPGTFDSFPPANTQVKGRAFFLVIFVLVFPNFILFQSLNSRD
jgi:hypothetical protein